MGDAASSIEVMDFGRALAPRWGTMEPSMDFGTLTRPEEVYNPGPTAADVPASIWKPEGEIVLGAHDSKIHDPSYTPIVHSLLTKDLSGQPNQFYPKGQLVVIFNKEEEARRSRRHLVRSSLKVQPTKCCFDKYDGLEELNVGDISESIRGVYPLSEGVVMGPSCIEPVAITVHDHAEVITMNPRKAKATMKEKNAGHPILQTPFYADDNPNHAAPINSSLWVCLLPDGDEFLKIPVINPTQDVIDGLTDDFPRNLFWHIGTLKQRYTASDDTFVLTFSSRRL